MVTRYRTVPAGLTDETWYWPKQLSQATTFKLFILLSLNKLKKRVGVAKFLRFQKSYFKGVYSIVSFRFLVFNSHSNKITVDQTKQLTFCGINSLAIYIGKQTKFNIGFWNKSFLKKKTLMHSFRFKLTDSKQE